MSKKTHSCQQMGDLHPVSVMRRYTKDLFGDDITMKYDLSTISWSISNKINYLITHCKVCTNYDCLRCTLRGIINQAYIILEKNTEQLTIDEEGDIMYVIEELDIILNKTAGGTLKKDNTPCLFYGYAKKCTQEVHKVHEVDEVCIQAFSKFFCRRRGDPYLPHPARRLQRRQLQWPEL